MTALYTVQIDFFLSFWGVGGVVSYTQNWVFYYSEWRNGLNVLPGSTSGGSRALSDG